MSCLPDSAERARQRAGQHGGQAWGSCERLVICAFVVLTLGRQQLSTRASRRARRVGVHGNGHCLWVGRRSQLASKLCKEGCGDAFGVATLQL
eukprot:351301-Chlamydomonas_euryale.AAC.4